ncbi:MAG: cupin domain-containing protein, partial [Halobacteriota archaeon]
MGTAQQLIKRLCLRPHPEGGYYREIYRSSESIAQDALPSRYDGARSFCTAVYYLLTAETFSAIHRVKTDEVWHFYCGDPVELLQLLPDGSGFLATLGSDVEKGMQPQA